MFFFPDKKMPSGKTMKQEFLDDLNERFSKPRGQGLQNKYFVNKYPITDRQIQRVINYYIRKKGLKYPKGETKAGDYKQKKERFGDVTDLTTEEAISKDIKKPLLKEKGLIKPRGTRPGVAVIDFAHRISKDHAKALGIQFGTETTGFDSRLINQVIVRPSEIRLDKFYERQRNILDKIKSKGATKELIKEMNEINGLINKEVKKTSGRLIGVNINPRTQETSFTGQKRNFKLSNLNKTFKEIKNIPYDERMKILRKEVAKSVDAEIKRGFRPFDFKEILGDPKNRQTLLRYAKEYAPDIFSKFKTILNNPMSKRRFALYSKLPAAAIPAGIVMALADQSGEALAAGEPGAKEGTSMLPTAVGAGAGAAAIGTKTGRNILKRTGRTIFDKGIRPLGTRLAGSLLAADQVRRNIQSGENVADAVVDPLVGLELSFPGLFKENLAKIITDPRAQRILNLGRFARLTTPVGLGITAAGLAVDVGKAIYKRKQLLDSMTPTQKDVFLAQEYEDLGGIAGEGAAAGGLIGKKSGPPPESGPTPQGLDYLIKRGRRS